MDCHGARGTCNGVLWGESVIVRLRIATGVSRPCND